MSTVLVPGIFFDDHRDRELPTPEVIAKRGASYLISRDDPNAPELLADARFYCDMRGAGGIDPARNRSLLDSAARTVRALAPERST